MKIEPIIILLFVSITFCLLGLASYLFGHIYVGLWIASFMSFLASFTVFIINDVLVEYEMPDSLKEQAQ